MSPFVLKWGILGSGWISSEFTKDISNSSKQIEACLHSITAVGARDKANAERFIAEYAPKGATAQQSGIVRNLPKARGTYQEVMEDPDVEIIYIGTIHTSHFELAMQSIDAGKHCLVEKPACLTCAQWEELSTAAKAKKVFLMEGVWTRFLPLSYEMEKKLLEDKIIGDIRCVRADFSMAFEDALPAGHRTLAKESAGGPMFDLGPYILLPALVALYYNPDNQLSWPDITACMQKSPTGVDSTTVIILSFSKIKATAILSTSFAYNSPKDEKLVISGTKGELVCNDGLSRITKMTIKTVSKGNKSHPTEWAPDETIDRGFEGFGLNYEADAVALNIRDGRLESPRVPHSFTATVLKIMDEVRRQGGYEL